MQINVIGMLDPMKTLWGEKLRSRRSCTRPKPDLRPILFLNECEPQKISLSLTNT